MGNCIRCSILLVPASNDLPQVKTFPLESQVDSLADLSDGFVLSKMLGTCSSGRPFVLLPPSICLRMLTSNPCRGLRPRLCNKRSGKKRQPFKMADQEEVVRNRLPRITTFHHYPLRWTRLPHAQQRRRFQCYCRT
jgi:hypothetical protein